LKYLLLGGISVAIRPTSIISYIPFYLYHVIYTASDWSTRAQLIGRTIQLVIYVLLGVLGFDFIWYRTNAVTFINFLKGNVLFPIRNAIKTSSICQNDVIILTMSHRTDEK